MSLLDNGPSSLINVDKLIDTIKEITFIPERTHKDGSFLYSVDHCFGIKGQGTVLTGTILNGQVKINDVSRLKVRNSKL